MEEAVRLECPECGLSYRLRRPVAGRIYYCRKCGGSLRPSDDALGLPTRPAMTNAFEAGEWRVTSREAPSGAPGPAEWRNLSQRLDEMSQLLAEEFKNRAEGLDGRVGEVLERLGEIRERLGEAGEQAESAAGRPELAELLAETERRILDSLAAERKAASAEPAENAPPTPKLDLDNLVDRLAKEIRGMLPRVDAESGSAIDAMARLADELVREQNANSVRLDNLAGEIHGAAASIANIREWRGELPIKVADEIGRTVEERMIGPISGALIRQAPNIVSSLQDSRLVDIVSRAVREAQRPLLREILAGGRVGVPVWLFAVVLLPLLIILGYQLLPGEFGPDPASAALARTAESLARLETGGAPLPPETDERLKNIEDTVLDLHGQALTHARNSSALEEQVKNLNSRLAEKEMLINEYNDTLQRQMRLLSAYRARLTQLGVPPESVQE
ncbi:MAG: hypothetical protein LBV15_01905 [Planctomycetota bacterium]|jgi:uncharacterized coiled-coil protein SlyX|nr:hypothetical protein [Planctomycetota bacterium]